MKQWTQLVLICTVVFCLSIIVVLVMDRVNNDLPHPFAGRTVFHGYVPDTAKAFPPPLSRTGEQDIMLRVSAEDAAAAQDVANRRNIRFKVTVE